MALFKGNTTFNRSVDFGNTRFYNDSMEEIFEGCSNYDQVTNIPESVISISNAFKGAGIENSGIYFDGDPNVKDISYAFSSMGKIENYTDIGSGRVCYSSIEIPNTVVNFSHAFEFIDGTASKDIHNVTHTNYNKYININGLENAKDLSYAFYGAINRNFYFPNKYGYIIETDEGYEYSYYNFPEGIENLAGTFSQAGFSSYHFNIGPHINGNYYYAESSYNVFEHLTLPKSIKNISNIFKDFNGYDYTFLLNNHKRVGMPKVIIQEDSKIEDYSGAFENSVYLDVGYLYYNEKNRGYDTSFNIIFYFSNSVTNISRTFYNSDFLPSYIYGQDMKNLISLENFIYSNLNTGISIYNFNTKKVQNFYNVFTGGINIKNSSFYFENNEEMNFDNTFKYINTFYNTKIDIIGNEIFMSSTFLNYNHISYFNLNIEANKLFINGNLFKNNIYSSSSGNIKINISSDIINFNPYYYTYAVPPIYNSGNMFFRLKGNFFAGDLNNQFPYNAFHIDSIGGGYLYADFISTNFSSIAGDSSKSISFNNVNGIIGLPYSTNGIVSRNIGTFLKNTSICYFKDDPLYNNVYFYINNNKKFFHNFKNVELGSTIVRPSSCDKEGLAESECVNCKGKGEMPLRKVAHNFVNGVCTICGLRIEDISDEYFIWNADNFLQGIEYQEYYNKYGVDIIIPKYAEGQRKISSISAALAEPQNSGFFQYNLSNLDFENNYIGTVFNSSPNFGVNLGNVIFGDTIEDISNGFYKLYSFNNKVILGNNILNMQNTFAYCNNFNQNIEIPESVKDIQNTFAYCSKFNQPIEIPNGITSLAGTFSYCNNFNQFINISNNLINMNSTFTNCFNFNQPIEIPSSVEDLYYTFSRCNNFNQPIEIPNNITSLAGTFSASGFNQPIKIPNSVTNMYYTFSGSKFNQNIEIPYGVLDMSSTFSSCSFPQDNIIIPDSVINMTGTFAYSFINRNKTQFVKLSNNVIDMSNIFRNCRYFNQEINLPNSVKNTSNAFRNCINFRQPILINDIDNMDNTFSNDRFFSTIELNNINKMTKTFSSGYSFNYINISNVNNMSNAFFYGGNFNENIYISNINDMSNAFSGSNYFYYRTRLYINNVNNMDNAFYNCKGLYSNYIYINNVTNLKAAFRNTQFSTHTFRATPPTVYLSGNIKDISQIFVNSTINCPITIPKTVINMSNAFYNCTAMTRLITIEKLQGDISYLSFQGGYRNYLSYKIIEGGEIISGRMAFNNSSIQLENNYLNLTIKDTDYVFDNSSFPQNTIISITYNGKNIAPIMVFYNCTGIDKVYLNSFVTNNLFSGFINTHVNKFGIIYSETSNISNNYYAFSNYINRLCVPTQEMLDSLNNAISKNTFSAPNSYGLHEWVAAEGGEEQTATCLEDGLAGKRQCKQCDYTDENPAVIPKLGHYFVDNKCERCNKDISNIVSSFEQYKEEYNKLIDSLQLDESEKYIEEFNYDADDIKYIADDEDTCEQLESVIAKYDDLDTIKGYILAYRTNKQKYDNLIDYSINQFNIILPSALTKSYYPEYDIKKDSIEQSNKIANDFLQLKTYVENQLTKIIGTIEESEENNE